METYGVLGRCEIFEFNYIHDYDIIIIGHERLSASKVQVLACYDCRRVLKLTRQREKMAVISKKQLNPRNTSHFMNKLMRQKKWSGQNLTSRTGSAAHVKDMPS